MELGRKNLLRVLRLRDNGAYLGDPDEARESGALHGADGAGLDRATGDSAGHDNAPAGGTGRDKAGAVLLPRSEVPDGAAPGDLIEVFLYLDSEDRPIATTLFPPLEVGSAAVLAVSQVTDIGAFLDWGLPKDLFLPFKEQSRGLHEGERVPVILYVDRSGRLAASMHIYSRLSPASGYKKNDKVTGLVYEIKKDLGAFVAVDKRYYGMIPSQELYEKIAVGDVISARVLKVRPDGKLDLSGRKKAYAQMKDDAETVLEEIKRCGGQLPFNDKASPEQIKAQLGLSKAAFKRAVGRLLRDGRITIGLDSIFIKK